jgi:hypothetical protein
MSFSSSAYFCESEADELLMGYNSELFIVADDSLLSDLTCGICADICREAIVTDNSCSPTDDPCSHTFCCNCIKKWLTQSAKCAACNKSLTTQQLRKDMKTRRTIWSLRSICPYNESFNCSWQGEFGREGENLNKHINQCESIIANCPNRIQGCNAQLTRKQYSQHKEACEFRVIQCNYCNNSIIAMDKSLHYSYCENYPIQCRNSNNGCIVNITRSSLASHLLDCAYEFVNCEYYELGCKEPILRCDASQHLNHHSIHHSTLIRQTIHSMQHTTESQSAEISSLHVILASQQGQINSLINIIAKLQLPQDETTGVTRENKAARQSKPLPLPATPIPTYIQQRNSIIKEEMKQNLSNHSLPSLPPSS